jgi:YfiH family protein
VKKVEPFRGGSHLLALTPWIDAYENVAAGITVRSGGFSQKPYQSLNMGFHVNDDNETVRQNRSTVSKTLGIPTARWTGTEQVHKAEIRKITAKDAGMGAMDLETAFKGTDGVYTTEKDLLLTSLYADCVPLYFFDPSKKIAGLAHAGWKGTALNIGGELVKKWVIDENADKDGILAAIGPSIGSCCYEVDEYVMSRMNEALGSRTDAAAKKVSAGKYMLDLKEANRQLLIASGLKENNIVVSNFCTSCRNDLFFSYRKDGGTTGRIMSYIMLKGDS